MSYCVNCGVELADSERRCPLCYTEVINPAHPWTESAYHPYPSEVDTLMEHIDRRYIASLLTVFLLIPVFITMVSNLVYGDGITWSAYVIGAAAMLFVWLILPLYFKSYRLLLFLCADVLAVIFYLLFIDLANDNVNWFLPIGLPISGTLGALVLISAFLFPRGNNQLLLIRISIVLIDISILSLVVEISTDLYALGEVALSWSPFAIIPCLILAVGAQMIERRKSLKEEIRKRMFY